MCVLFGDLVIPRERKMRKTYFALSNDGAGKAMRSPLEFLLFDTKNHPTKRPVIFDPLEFHESEPFTTKKIFIYQPLCICGKLRE